MKQAPIPTTEGEPKTEAQKPPSDWHAIMVALRDLSWKLLPAVLLALAGGIAAWTGLLRGWFFAQPLWVQLAVAAGVLGVIVLALALCLRYLAAVGRDIINRSNPGTGDPPSPVDPRLSARIKPSEDAQPITPSKLVGRNRLLSEVETALRESARNRANGTKSFALRGIFGSGKTALAATIGAKFSEEVKNPPAFPGGVAWIDCEGLQKGDLDELWRRVAEQVGYGELADKEDRKNQLTAILEQRPLTLLILNNIEIGLEVTTAIQTLARPGKTVVLITTRQPGARIVDMEFEVPYELDPPPSNESTPDPAIVLFTEMLHKADPQRPDRDDQSTLPDVVNAFHRHPQTLVIKASYAGVQHISLSDLLTELRDRPLPRPDTDPSKDTFFEDINPSWQKLTQAQQDLLAGLTMLTQFFLPRDLALRMASALYKKPNTKGSENLDLDARAYTDIDTLVSYSLLLPRKSRLELHPVIREFAGKHLKELESSSLYHDMGIAATVYWRDAGKNPPWTKQGKALYDFVNSKLRKGTRKAEWLSSANVHP